MDDYLEEIHQLRFINDEKHIKLLQQIVDEIKTQNLSNDEIISILSNVDAEIVDDIIKMMEDERFLTKDDGKYIDDELIKIYEEEFIKDFKSGTLKTRLALKTDKNPRPISRFEILGIYFSKTLNNKILWGLEETDDEFLNALVQTHKELCLVRKENTIFDKQKRTMNTVLMEILNQLNDKKTQTL